MKNVSFLVIFFSFVSFGQTKFNLKTQFEEINISKFSPNDLSKLNRSRESFEVKVSGRKLVINEKIRRNVSELKIKGGVLKGLNNGEWGGKLSFISNTNRESELLFILTQHKNSISDRTYILKKLWGNDDFFNARSMDVFITKLRKKLKDDQNIQIVNVRGYGYKLIC